jgi:hypothetical protein
MIRITIAAMAVSLCVACSTTSGVVPSGKDTYLISRSEKGFDKTGARVKAAIFKEASDFCAESGKTMEVIKANEKDMVPLRSDAQAEVKFRCN